MPRPKLFVSAGRLQDQRPQPRKYFLGLSPGKDVFCSSVTKQDRRMAPRPKLFVSEGRLHVKYPKNVLGSRPGRYVGFRDNNLLLLLLLLFIYCNWVCTRWQWSLHYTITTKEHTISTTKNIQ
jgi:hypothetical protein